VVCSVELKENCEKIFKIEDKLDFFVEESLDAGILKFVDDE